MAAEQNGTIDGLLTGMRENTSENRDLQETENKQVLKLARTYKHAGETVIKLVSSRWYCETDAKLLDVADDLMKSPEIRAVAVVDENGSCIGLLYRRDLTLLLSRPFGREVMKDETVGGICEPAEPMFLDTGIFAAAEKLSQYDHYGDIKFFPCKSLTSEFAGMFSTQDLLIYLSQITHADMSLARSVQKRLVPERLNINDTHFEITAASTASRLVGGDFYAVKKTSGDSWFLTLCDVSGNGLSAAMISSTLAGAIESAGDERDMQSMIGRLNKSMNQTFGEDKTVTGVFIQLYAASGAIDIADMGHGMAFIYRQGKLLKLKSDQSSNALGSTSNMQAPLFHYSLEKNDLVLLVSDGLISQENIEGESFGIKRLKDVLDVSSTPSETAEKLIDHHRAFRNNKTLIDDVTFILLKWRG